MTSFLPQILPEGVLFRESPSGNYEKDSLSYLPTDAESAALGFLQKGIGLLRPGRPSAQTIALAPLWNLPAGLYLANLPVAVHKSEWFLLADHCETQDTVNEDRLIVKEKVVPKDGYHAALLCFSPRFSVPHELRLRFESADGCPPVSGVNPGHREMFPNMPATWIVCTDGWMIFGREKAVRQKAFGIGYKTGIWTMRFDAIEAALVGERQTAQKSE